jgi:hypothetical protein
MSTAELYTIFCLIEGQENPFSVKITSNETVDQLKEAIKAKKFKTLEDVEADTLKLYHVSILTCDPINKKTIINYVAKAQEEMKKPQLPPKLDPASRLDDVFEGNPPERTLHIIVRIPSG